MKIDVYGQSDNADHREHLATFIINGIDEVATSTIGLKDDSSKPKVSLSFELTRSGLIQLNKAEANIDETYTVEEKPLKKKAKKVTEEAKEAKKSDLSEDESTEDKDEKEE